MKIYKVELRDVSSGTGTSVLKTRYFNTKQAAESAAETMSYYNGEDVKITELELESED